MTKKDKQEFMQERVRMELGLRISQLIQDFKSKEEPTYKKKLTRQDVIFVLSKMINRRCE